MTSTTINSASASILRWVWLWLLLLVSHRSFAQLVHTGGQLNILPGTTVTILADLSNTAGTIDQSGTLLVTGSIVNAAGATLRGVGTYYLRDNWTNAGVFFADTSEVVFQGMSNSTLTSGGSSFYALKLDKIAADLLLADAATVNQALEFVADNNKLQTGAFDLSIAPAGRIVGFDDNDFVLTAGAGRLIKQGLDTTDFVYPVGAETSTYNPLTLAENGTSDDIGVRCIAQLLALGLYGAPIDSGVVNAAWVITERDTGSSNLSVIAQWSDADELPGFERDDCGIAGFRLGPDWDLPPAALGMSAGTGPFTRLRLGLAPGTIAVAGQSLLHQGLGSHQGTLRDNYSTRRVIRFENSATVAVYPNPASDHLFIQLQGDFPEDEHVEITLWDMKGALVLSRKTPAGSGRIITLTMGNNAVPAGMYLLRLRSERGLHYATRVAIQQND